MFNGCKEITDQVNAVNPISKASVYAFLELELQNGVLDHIQVSGKGGVFRHYGIKYDESEYIEYIIRHILEKMLNEWELETKKAIKSLTLT